MLPPNAGKERSTMGYAFSSLDALGEGYGFRKIRRGLGVTAFGANALVMPPGYDGFLHFHDTQDELYFVHRGTARFEVDGESRDLGPGSLVHVESTTPRKFSNAGDDDLIVIVIGGQGGYVERDGHLVDPDRDLERRMEFGS
jgi:mannose-6-phosphate isomerase-like protein (cupin superfamily)